MSSTDENILILNKPTRHLLLKNGPPRQNPKNILGRGAYGIVFKAIFKSRPVAVKIVKNLPEYHFRTVLRNESHVFGLKHSNIIRIIKIESALSYGMIIMERVTGPCLQKVLDTVDLHVTHRIYITLDIVSALKYIHERRLLHLDVKPKNIVISWQYNNIPNKTKNYRYTNKPFMCKLCDFGSSLILSKYTVNYKDLIQGTIRYMAPEALVKEHLTPLTDVYSVGIMMWQLKYRIVPYKWLPCNEIVAYQVLKNNIRPNSVDHDKPQEKEMNRNSSTQHNDSGTTSQIIRNVFTFIKCENNKREKKENNISDPENANNSNRNIQLRNPLQNLSNKIMPVIGENEKVACNLVEKPSLKESAAIMSEGATSTSAFQSESENQYQKVYESCWQRDPNDRPSSADLYKLLRQIVF